MINLILLTGFSFWIGLLHPFHISICEIEHSKKDRSLQITTRIFQDDFELNLKGSGKIDGFFQHANEQEANAVLTQFFKDHLKLKVDEQPIQITYLGFEIEENVVWCYLETDQVDDLTTVDLTYSVLIDTFEDQINLAHVEYKDQVKSLKLQSGQLSGTVTFAK